MRMYAWRVNVCVCVLRIKQVNKKQTQSKGQRIEVEGREVRNIFFVDGVVCQKRQFSSLGPLSPHALPQLNPNRTTASQHQLSFFIQEFFFFLFFSIVNIK